MKTLLIVFSVLAADSAYAQCTYVYPAASYGVLKGVPSEVEFSQRDIGSSLFLYFDSVKIDGVDTTCVKFELVSSNSDIAKLQMLQKQALVSLTLGHQLEATFTAYDHRRRVDTLRLRRIPR